MPSFACGIAGCWDGGRVGRGALFSLNDPAHLMKDAEDVGWLHFFHCIGIANGGAEGPEYTSSIRSTGPFARIVARSMTFSNSRMLPGHAYLMRRSMVDERRLDPACRACLRILR